MKKLSILFFFVAVATMSFGQLAGSSHDFSGAAWNTMASNKICGPCHAPHNGLDAANGPLWSHEASVGPFVAYTSPFNTMVVPAGTPTGVSLYCMGCHDGSVELNSHTGGTAVDFIPVAFEVDADLGDDHPISFVYNTATNTADDEIENPSVALSGLGGTIEADLLFGTAGAATLECASCHEVHGNANDGMLHLVNTNSQLCLTCHIK